MNALSCTPLTEEQVARLFDFCREHDVSYYDVQVELVDHIAAAIEDRMKAGLTFEQALQVVFRGFGHAGFASVVETRSKQLRAANNRQLWSLFIAYFTWPKAMLTLLILSVLYVLSYYCPIPVLKAIAITTTIYLVAFETFIILKRRLRYRKPTAPLLLLKRGWPFPFTSTVLLNIYFNVFRGFRWMDGNKPFNVFSYNAYIIAFVIMLAFVLAVYDTKRKLYYMARERYPGAFSVPDITG